MFANIEDITLLCGDAKLLYKSRKNGQYNTIQYNVLYFERVDIHD